jgi:4'-phosphopantetheinyl transferase
LRILVSAFIAEIQTPSSARGERMSEIHAAAGQEIPVRVYIADLACLTEEECFLKGLKRVSEMRREKIRRLRCREDQIRSLGAGLLLCRGLTDLGIDPDVVRMIYGKNQKPRMEGIPWFSFNLSHSGMRAMCAIGTQKVGCDVEQIHGIQMEKVTRRFYTNQEQEYLFSIEDPAEREDAFFRLWTLKESVIKFTGHGMAQGLDTFSIDFRGERPIMIEMDESVSRCRFREYFPGDGYHYSCCAEKDSFEEEARMIDLLNEL